MMEVAARGTGPCGAGSPFPERPPGGIPTERQTPSKDIQQSPANLTNPTHLECPEFLRKSTAPQM